MATARRCSGCGASLGEPTDDDLTVVCRFCGLRHDLNDLAGVFVAYRTSERLGTARRDTTTAVQQRVAETRRSLTLDELPGLTEFGWKTIDVPPPGSPGEFEPIAALPWALTIGRAWAADAVVTRIDVGWVSATGVGQRALGGWGLGAGVCHRHA